MTFPYFIPVGPWQVHPHFFFELLAYFLGFQYYRWLSKRSDQPLPAGTKMWFLVACVGGAALLARLLAWVETPYDVVTGRWIPPGKTIVGGLLGGWIGIEWVKSHFKITRRTGDAYVFPLIFGIALGRIGCFLTGLADHTYGIATTLPWGVDFGDGILRPPTQLYECFWLIGTGLVLFLFRRSLRHDGLLFRGFMLSYLSFRWTVEWWKPTLKIYGGMSAIQWACLFGLIALGISLRRILIKSEGPFYGHLHNR